MIRTLVLLVVGAALGVVATLLLVLQRDASPEPDDTPLALFSSDALTTAAPVPVPAPEVSRDFYRRLADADARELGRMIVDTAAEPPSTDRDLAVAVLLKRHADLDVVGAVRLAREVGVRGAALGTVYSAWARRAPAQVLAALGTIGNPDDAADVALALIVTLGNDASAVEQVAAALGERDDEPLLGTATVPVAPIIAATGPSFLAPSRSPLGLLAARWAELDPRHALSAAREVGEERVRNVFEAAALRALARVAPEEVFAEIGDRSGSSVQREALAAAAVELARVDPERLLGAASSLPNDIRRLAELAAMQQLAERDPAAAVRHLERLPGGPERQMFLRTIARAYGKRDAAAALAWARSQGGQQGLDASVIGGVAEQDLDHALDLALELTSPIERMQAVQFAASVGTRTDADAEAVANRLFAVDDPAAREWLALSIVSTWSARSPDSAMRWVLGNAQTVSPNVYQHLGQALAMRDPRNAIAYSAQIPSTAREAWMSGLAQGYAQNDPQSAIDWLRQYRGEPWYDQATSTIAMSLAQSDGAAAARLIDEFDDEPSGMEARQLVPTIAANWANDDPAAAAAWAANRRNEREREMAVSTAVGIWASQDFDGARQWALRLPQGGARDSALTRLLTTSAYSAAGGLDTTVLNAITSDSARQLAVMQIVQGLAYNDPARARRFVDVYLTDPNARAEAERAIEAASSNGGRLRPGMGVAGGVRAIPPSVVFQSSN